MYEENSVIEYVQTTDSVLRAGRRLQKVLESDKSTLDFGVSQLEAAAHGQESKGAGYRAFMFAQLEGAPETAKDKRERVTEDLLVSVLADLQTANVLMAAGQTLGETGKKADSRVLDEALMHLENTKRNIERTLVSPLTEGAKAGRFGFADELTGEKAVPVADLASGVKEFTDRSNDALNSLVEEAQGVVKYIVDALAKIDQERVLDALGKLGESIKELQGIGRLFSQGVEKFKKAINALISLLGSKALAQIKERAEQVWKAVREGKLLGQVLTWAFDVDATRNHIKQIMATGGLSKDAVNTACDDLAQLKVKFQENMAMARRLSAGVAFAGALLAFTPIAGPAALMAASAYVLILAAVVLIGMDYADSGRILDRVRGVDEIASSLKPA